MESMYLIISNDKFIVTEKIKDIIKNNNEIEVVKYDLLDTNIDVVIEDLDTYNFLTNKKLIIAYNAYFLTGETVKNSIEHNIEKLEKYINNPSPDNILVLTINTKLDERKKINKIIKSKFNIIEGLININKIVKDNLEDYKMDDKTIRYLIDYSKEDNEKIISELNKLKLYKYDEKIITIEDINNIVTKSIDDNIFDLVDAIIKKNKKKALEIYEELLLHNEDVTKILILVANKFRLMYQVKVLSKEKMTNEEIGKTIGSHPYPVKLARELIIDYSEDDLINCLSKLADLDNDMKSGNIYQNVGFETFILDL